MLKRTNKIEIKGTIATIEIYHPDGNRYAIIDAVDAERCDGYLWSWSCRSEITPQVVTRLPPDRRTLTLSKFLLDGSEKGRKTFHLNENYLDYRKENIKRGHSIRIDGGVAYISAYLWEDKKMIEIMIDLEDISTIQQYSLRVARSHRTRTYLIVSGYKMNSPDKKKSSLARILMSPPRNKEVDHINRNPLDNRRINLRIVTKAANNQNRKTNYGVHRTKEGKYGLMVCLGSYRTLYEIQRVLEAVRTFHTPFSPVVTNDFEE